MSISSAFNFIVRLVFFFGSQFIHSCLFQFRSICNWFFNEEDYSMTKKVVAFEDCEPPETLDIDYYSPDARVLNQSTNADGANVTIFKTTNRFNCFSYRMKRSFSQLKHKKVKKNME